MKRAMLIFISALLLLGVSYARQISVKGKTNQGSFGTAPTVKLNLSAQFSEPSGNYALDPGETGSVLVTIKNEGDAEAKSVTVRMTSNVPGMLSFPSLKTIGSVAANNSTSARIDISASEQTKKQIVIMTVEALDVGGVKSEAKTVTIPVEAPAPPILSASTEFLESSGNKLLDSGESGTVTVTVSNSGGTSAKGVAVKVALPTGSIGLSISGSVALGEIAPKASKSGTFILIASENAPTQTARLSIDVSSSDGVRAEPVSLVVNVKERLIVRDTTPPEIELREPVSTTVRGIKVFTGVPEVKTRNSSVAIKGVARDSGGVAQVLVNGEEVRLSTTREGMEFNHTLLLALGDNEIEIKALDRFKNENKLTLVVRREEPLFAGQNYALIFAVDAYDSWSRLTNPINDARAITEELRRSYGFNSELIEDVTRDRLLSALRRYAEKKYGENDQLFIFFAGHGQFDEVLGDGYLVAKDSKLNDDIKTSYVSHSNLRTIVNNIACKHIFLVVDACFGGTFDPLIAANLRGEDEYKDITKTEFIQRKMRFKTRRFLTSGGKEYVPDGRPGQHSPFTRKLLEALRSYGGKDGILTINEILQYVEKVKPEPRAGEFGTNEPGSDFIFIAR